MIAQLSHVSRRLLLVTALAFAIPLAWAAPVDDAVAELQREWEVTRYQAPAAERQKRFEALAARAHQVSETHAGRAEPLVWEGIIVSSLAGEKGGLGALSLVKQAKALYEQAIQIDGNVLDGSAYNSLGVLYYKVPGWPVGFGDKKKARELLQKALAINPKGIDPNYFFAEYLVESKQAEEAVPYLERALQAPPRPGRPIADQGRKEEAKALMEKVKGH
jgi:tetratricopeptide (TPR) repeat protein